MGACMTGSMCGEGHAWQGACMGGMCGRGVHATHDAPPHPRQILWHTVNEWAVRILLECILVLYIISQCARYFAASLVAGRLNYKSAAKPCVFISHFSYSHFY